MRIERCLVAVFWAAVIPCATGHAGPGPVWDVSPGQPGMNGKINFLYAADASSPTGPALLAGGEFTSAGGADIAAIARWDGESWSAVGDGADGVVQALMAVSEAAGGAALAVAGDFTMAGGEPANRVALLRSALPGDLDGNGLVDVRDLLLLLGAWGDCPDPPAACPADLDGDGSVGVTDFLILLADWT
jgi:hypothetical protein